MKFSIYPSSPIPFQPDIDGCVSVVGVGPVGGDGVAAGGAGGGGRAHSRRVAAVRCGLARVSTACNCRGCNPSVWLAFKSTTVCVNFAIRGFYYYCPSNLKKDQENKHLYPIKS